MVVEGKNRDDPRTIPMMLTLALSEPGRRGATTKRSTGQGGNA